LPAVKKNELSAARNIAGTWKASAPVTVYELTNCTGSGQLVNYTSFQCYFTFIITAVDDNNVTVEIYGSARSNQSDGCGQSPPIEDGYPITWRGKISSSALTLIDHVYAKNTYGVLAWGDYDVGDFTFTTDILSGSIFWLQYYTSQDCIGWKTDKITLTRSK